MDHSLLVLVSTAALIGCVHTLLGPDHYLPFIMMGRAQKWSRSKTLGLTAVCGLGHIFSSVVLGGIGIGLGLAVTRMEAVEAARGTIAAWALIAFGAIYFIWGMRRAARNRPHVHWHKHPEGLVHKHTHTHAGEHLHVHASPEGAKTTPWILFIIFVFGPCEALIPILMYPAAQSSLIGILAVTLVFGITTLVTMLGAVLFLTWTTDRLPLGRWEHYSHAVAGGAVCLSGIAIQALGF